MRDTTTYIILALVVVLAAALWFGGPRGDHPLRGKPAPAIALDTLDGGELDLAALQGEKIVLLDFWATWCGPCRSSMPAVAEVAREFADRDVVLYAVNQNEDPQLIRAFLDDMKLDVNVALDPAYQAGRAYEVTGIPQLVIVGKDGIVQAVHVGAAPGLKRELRHQLDTLVSGGTLVEPAAF
jgi:thiol-disulfide isomerase/thioredoxin